VRIFERPTRSSKEESHKRREKTIPSNFMARVREGSYEKRKQWGVMKGTPGPEPCGRDCKENLEMNRWYRYGFNWMLSTQWTFNDKRRAEKLGLA